MKRIFFTVFLLSLLTVQSQELVFRERSKVFLNLDDVKVIKNTDKMDKAKDTTYAPDGKILSYKSEKILDYEKKAKQWTKFLDDYAGDESTKVKLKAMYTTFASVKVDEDKLIIYPLKYTAKTNNDLNTFFKDYKLYIEMENGKPVSIKFSNYHFGIVTIPFKLYLGNNDDKKGNNFVTEGNIMGYFGHRWGSTKYLKLPNKKEVEVYKHAYSVNYLLGFSKIAMDEKNTYGSGTLFEGDVASLTTGFSMAMHYKKFSGMIACGLDFPFDYQNQWVFTHKPWIGLGFGFELFKLNEGN